MWDNTDQSSQGDEYGLNAPGNWIFEIAFFGAIILAVCTLGLIVLAIIA